MLNQPIIAPKVISESASPISQFFLPSTFDSWLNTGEERAEEEEDGDQTLEFRTPAMFSTPNAEAPAPSPAPIESQSAQPMTPEYRESPTVELPPMRTNLKALATQNPVPTAATLSPSTVPTPRQNAAQILSDIGRMHMTTISEQGFRDHGLVLPQSQRNSFKFPLQKPSVMQPPQHQRQQVHHSSYQAPRLPPLDQIFWPDRPMRQQRPLPSAIGAGRKNPWNTQYQSGSSTFSNPEDSALTPLTAGSPSPVHVVTAAVPNVCYHNVLVPSFVTAPSELSMFHNQLKEMGDDIKKMKAHMFLESSWDANVPY
jgi:hypothetical protein